MPPPSDSTSIKSWIRLFEMTLPVESVGLAGHLNLVRPSAPPDRDRRIRDVIDLVVRDQRVPRVANHDADATAKLRANVFEQIVVDRLSLANSASGASGLSTPGQFQPVAGDIGEHRTFHHVVLCAIAQVEPRRAKMHERVAHELELCAKCNSTFADSFVHAPYGQVPPGTSVHSACFE